MIHVKSIPLTCSKTSTISIECDNFMSTDLLKRKLDDVLNIKPECYTVYRGKCILQGKDLIENDDIVHMHFNVLGGKGGFGSMLRAIGAQIEKTTNKEACRDLSGRRLRDINEEQRLKKWIAKQTERERERDERRKQRLQRLLQKPKHEFHDPEYDKALSNLAGNINDALTEGLKKSEQVESEPTTSKRKVADEVPSSSSKKRKGWQMDDDFDNLSSSDGDDSDSDQSNNGSSSNQAGNLNENSTDTQDESSKNINNVSQSDENQETSSDLISSPDTDSKPNIEEVKSEAQQILDIDLDDYNTIEQLEALSLETLKVALQKRGMKCGGTARQRAERLFNYKN